MSHAAADDVAAWRPATALLVSVSIVFFVSTSTAQVILVFWCMVPMPLTASQFFNGLVMAMGYELNSRVLWAAQIAGTAGA